MIETRKKKTLEEAMNMESKLLAIPPLLLQHQLYHNYSIFQ